MSQYIVLSHIEIQNANSIAGLTWGFPAITQFLGFTHALSRKLSSCYEGEYDFDLKGCAVISNSVHNKVYQPKEYADFEFIQSKNPPVLSKHKSASPPIIEEGKMNLTISLVIELDKPLIFTTDQLNALTQKVLTFCYRMRIAGGTVLNIKDAKLFSASTKEQHDEMLKKVKRITMPGFVLLDRKNYLQQHYQELLMQHAEGKNTKDKPQLIDAWLDFSALKYKAVADLAEGQNLPDKNTPASWEYVSKPNAGYLVPLMTGYKAISELYEPGEVQNTRDENTPSRFVEAIHSVGEWKGMHSTKDIAAIIWRYHHDDDYDQWYICKQNDGVLENETLDNQIEEFRSIDLNDALNLF